MKVAELFELIVFKDLKPGDFICLRYRDGIPEEYALEIKTSMERALPAGVRCMIMGEAERVDIWRR